MTFTQGGKKRGVWILIGNAPTMMSQMKPGGVFKLNQILPIFFSHLKNFFGYSNKDLDYQIESCGARAFTRCQKIVMERLRVSATGQLLPILMVGPGALQRLKVVSSKYLVVEIKFLFFGSKPRAKKTGIYAQPNLKLNWQQIYSKQTSVNGVRRLEGGTVAHL